MFPFPVYNLADLALKNVKYVVISRYIEKWTFKGMCEVYYRAKRDKKEATCL